MGVTGLWRLIEPAGKPVPVETLENKVLAVDISIWLHQMVKGYQDAKGAPLPNAHLMGLFQRLCKLLYFKIKPIFVFDGGFPELKKETIATRQDQKAKYNSESERIKRELALLLSKKTAVSSLLGKQISPKKSSNNASKNDDIFKLPALPQREEESESDSEEETSSGSIIDLHSVDIESEDFKTMSVKEKYDLLMELKETRKMNSWGKLHQLPKKSDSFSDFQMQRLLKRRKVQECLEETEKEMVDSGMSLNELEDLLNEEGIDTKIDSIPTRRIASNETTRFLLIKDLKQALAEARKRKDTEKQPGNSKNEDRVIYEDTKPDKVDELEDDLQKAIKMSLECLDDPNVNATPSKTDDSWTSYMTDSEDACSLDSEEDDGFVEADNMSSAKAYIMQYSDFTYKTIDNLVANKKANDKNKIKIPNVDEILEEIHKEKSVVVDNIDLSSSDEDCFKNKTQYAEKNLQNATETNYDSEEFLSLSKNTLDTTQCSVVCINNSLLDIITLDSSIETCNEILTQPSQINTRQLLDSNNFEEVTEIKEGNPLSNNSVVLSADINRDSDSCDDEFEEVPEMESNLNKPIVQLTLNMGDVPEDDIFADIFEDQKNIIKSDAEVSSQNISEHTDPKSNVNEHRKMKPVDIKVLDSFEEQSNTTIAEAKTEASFTQPLSKTLPDTNACEQVTVNNNLNTKNKLTEIKSVEDKIAAERKAKIVEISVSQPLNKETHDKFVLSNNTDIQKEVMEGNLKKHSEALHSLETTHKEVLSTEKLNSLVEKIQNDERDLLEQKGRLDRVGRNITEQMTKEAQELLQIFGIPYIVAPMEAEAQCAFLENANLTDGTITDDSDIWLFGGRIVYKNFFNHKKHVLQFLAERIEKSFNLNREQLILLALLVGSDYTTGITGVGPVTALEILASFPFNSKQLHNETSKHAKYMQVVKGLQEFKHWVRAGKRTDNISLKKKLKNISLSDDFPSVRVVQAYLEPNVEKSEEKFSWGEIDITVLRDYTRTKFGWSQNKLDEIIKPVLKRVTDVKTQRSIQDFFKRKVEFQSLEVQMSKRVKAAVQRMRPEKPLEDMIVEEANKPTKKRKLPKSKINPTKMKVMEAAGSSVIQHSENEKTILDNHGVKIVTEIKDDKSEFEIVIPKSIDRFQEIIPQREKEKRCLLQNKLKAIEVFRKTNIDKRKKNLKKKVIRPKEKAHLSESDSD